MGDQRYGGGAKRFRLLCRGECRDCKENKGDECCSISKHGNTLRNPGADRNRSARKEFYCEGLFDSGGPDAFGKISPPTEAAIIRRRIVVWGALFPPRLEAGTSVVMSAAPAPDLDALPTGRWPGRRRRRVVRCHSTGVQQATQGSGFPALLERDAPTSVTWYAPFKKPWRRGHGVWRPFQSHPSTLLPTACGAVTLGFMKDG